MKARYLALAAAGALWAFLLPGCGEPAATQDSSSVTGQPPPGATGFSQTPPGRLGLGRDVPSSLGQTPITGTGPGPVSSGTAGLEQMPRTAPGFNQAQPGSPGLGRDVPSSLGQTPITGAGDGRPR